MNYLAIAVTLLTFLLGLMFLAKTRTEYTGSFNRIMAYLVLLVAAGLLIIQIFSGCSMYWHNRMPNKSGHGPYNHMGGHMYMNNNDNCNGNMDCGDCMGDMNCGDHRGKVKSNKNKNKKRKRYKNKRNADSTDVIFESSTDTIDGKIIRKEIEIRKEK